MKKKIILKAPLLTRSGYGEQARFALRSLRSRPDLFDIYILPLQWGKTSWINDLNEERDFIDKTIEKTNLHLKNGGSFDMSLQVTIPNEWERLAPVNVGYTAGLEATYVDSSWLIKANEVIDRIIVVSNHSKHTYENTQYKGEDQNKNEVILRLEKPIEAVNYPYKEYEEKPEVDLSELKTDFNFLVVAQNGPRKNLPNTLKWFIEEFKDEEVGLVVKTNLMKNCLMDRLQTYNDIRNLVNQANKEKKCKIYLLHGDMTDEEMHMLYVHPKISALLTLSHGEGFGLPIFEASYSGLPVVATGWSGQLDFLIDNKKKENFYNVTFDIAPIPKQVEWKNVIPAGTMWAYPRESSAKENMRLCYEENKDKRQARWAKHAKYLHKEFAKEKMYEKFVTATVGVETPKVDVADLPKVSIITSVYNGDEYIKPFMEDITRQSIFKEKCELILINANSPGNEEEVILEYQKKFPDNIVYKRLEEDPGIYGTWNIGLKMATGEFLTNANLDDRKAIDSLERHAAELLVAEDVDLVYSDMMITDQPNENYEKNNSNGRRYNFPEFSFENLKMVNMPHSSPMWRKQVHEKYGFFDETFRSAGDWEMWLRAASQGSKFKKINDVLGLYYFNPTGISTNPENFGWKREEESKVYETYKDVEL